MFNYEIKMRKLNNSNSKLKAFVSLVIDNVMEIDGFKVIEGRNGLFVSVPSHKGTVMEDGQQVEKYFDDVRFPGEEALAFREELKNSILQQYSSGSYSAPAPAASQPSRAQAAKANAASKEDAQSTDEPARDRKPLWGF